MLSPPLIKRCCNYLTSNKERLYSELTREREKGTGKLRQFWTIKSNALVHGYEKKNKNENIISFGLLLEQPLDF